MPAVCAATAYLMSLAPGPQTTTNLYIYYNTIFTDRKYNSHNVKDCGWAQRQDSIKLEKETIGKLYIYASIIYGRTRQLDRLIGWT